MSSSTTTTATTMPKLVPMDTIDLTQDVPDVVPVWEETPAPVTKPVAPEEASDYSEEQLAALNRNLKRMRRIAPEPVLVPYRMLECHEVLEPSPTVLDCPIGFEDVHPKVSCWPVRSPLICYYNTKADLYHKFVSFGESREETIKWVNYIWLLSQSE